ncbi:MAG: hypothetical protein QM775_19210 [Pirellulales bacterium]
MSCRPFVFALITLFAAASSAADKVEKAAAEPEWIWLDKVAGAAGPERHVLPQRVFARP